MKLVIDRNKWIRGEGNKSKLLRSSDNKMCCLGFFGQAIGVPDSSLMDLATPESSRRRGGVWLRADWLFENAGFKGDSVSCCKLMHFNDSHLLTESEREAAITTRFAQHDIQVEFIN